MPLTDPQPLPPIDWNSFSNEDLTLKRRSLEFQIQKNREEISEIYAHLKPLLDEQKEISKVLDFRAIEAMDSTGEINWPFLLEEDGGTPESRGKAFKKALRSLSPLFNGYCGLYFNGAYHPETSQRSIKISLRQGDDELTKETAKAIEVLLPFLKKKSPPDPARLSSDLVYSLGVFEDSLSEHGVITVVINSDKTKFSLYKNRYPIIVKKTLLGVLTYVQEYHYYSMDN